VVAQAGQFTALPILQRGVEPQRHEDRGRSADGGPPSRASTPSSSDCRSKRSTICRPAVPGGRDRSVRPVTTPAFQPVAAPPEPTGRTPAVRLGRHLLRQSHRKLAHLDPPRRQSTVPINRHSESQLRSNGIGKRKDSQPLCPGPARARGPWNPRLKVLVDEGRYSVLVATELRPSSTKNLRS